MRKKYRDFARVRNEVYELSATQLVAKVYHELRIRCFNRIARLTRYQISDIICCDRDKDGYVILSERLNKRSQSEGVSNTQPVLCDYQSIVRHVERTRLQHLGWPAADIEAEVERRWLATPAGKATQQYHEMQRAAALPFQG